MTIGWYPLDLHGPPAAGVPVLVTVATMRPLVRVATWQPQYTMLAHDDELAGDDYDERTDCYYAPEGWYPAGLPDEEGPLYRISYGVTAWAPLPEAWQP